MILLDHRCMASRLIVQPGLGRVAILALLAGIFAHPQMARGQSAPPGQPTGMDAAISILNDARGRFRNVADYECRLIKRERVNGELLPESVMTMRVRNHPFSVYLLCESPKTVQGLEICYVAGCNNGMMRVHPSGLLGVLGFVSLDTRDPRAFENNRHCITEIGLGNLLESTSRYWEIERRLNKTVVQIKDEELDGHSCIRIETDHPDRSAGSFYGYRCVLWLDKQTLLPVGAETYDWPRRGGSGSGDLLERYRFQELRCNIGLRESTFSH